MSFDYTSYGPQITQVVLSAGQLDAFNTTPFPILPAPGANLFISVARITSVFIQTGGNFYGADGGVAMCWGNTPIPNSPDTNGVNPNSTLAGHPMVCEWDYWGHSVIYAAEASAGINQPLKVQSNFNWNTVGQIATSHLTNAGTGYNPGDQQSLGGVPDNLILTVDTVTGGPPGPIATYHITQAPGPLPAVGQTYSISDVGDGNAILHVDTVTPGSNGKFVITVHYYIFPSA